MASRHSPDTNGSVNSQPDPGSHSVGSRRRRGRRRGKKGTPPWLGKGMSALPKRQGVATSLGLEMSLFCAYSQRCCAAMAPEVNTMLGGLRSAAQQLWPGCTMELYGSMSTGLQLPTSDVDVILTVREGLRGAFVCSSRPAPLPPL